MKTKEICNYLSKKYSRVCLNNFRNMDGIHFFIYIDEDTNKPVLYISKDCKKIGEISLEDINDFKEIEEMYKNEIKK